MQQRPPSRARGYLSRGALLALLVHVHVLTPIGVAAWIYGGRQQAAREAQRAQEGDVDFQQVAGPVLPKDRPPTEPLADQLEPPKPPKPRADRRRADKKEIPKTAEE